MLHLDKISIIRNGTTIVDSVSLALATDKQMAIFGPNGSGKSMLGKVLAADLVPSSGSVSILGYEFGRSDLRKLRSHIGFIAGRLELMFEANATCLDVVASGFKGVFGKPSEITQSQHTQIEMRLTELEIENLIYQEFNSLSDGEKKRVLLARALVNDPLFLVFDEPCQGLDIKGRSSYLILLEELGKRIPYIYITHYVEELPRCISEVVFLKAGKILARGKKEELLTSDNLTELFNCNIQITNYSSGYYGARIY
jgi:iron complex transport system ATP-binding protein